MLRIRNLLPTIIPKHNGLLCKPWVAYITINLVTLATLSAIGFLIVINVDKLGNNTFITTQHYPN